MLVLVKYLPVSSTPSSLAGGGNSHPVLRGLPLSSPDGEGTPSSLEGYPHPVLTGGYSLSWPGMGYHCPGPEMGLPPALDLRWRFLVIWCPILITFREDIYLHLCANKREFSFDNIVLLSSRTISLDESIFYFWKVIFTTCYVYVTLSDGIKSCRHRVVV